MAPETAGSAGQDRIPTTAACIRHDCGRDLSDPFLRWQIQYPLDKVARGPYCRDCYVQITARFGQ